MELKVLSIVFSDKVLHVVLLEGTKENELGTCDSERKKESHYIRKCILCKRMT